MDNKQKAKSLKNKRKEKHKADNEKLRRYKIAQIAKKQDISLEDAENLFNKRTQNQEIIGKRKKNRGKNKKTKSWSDSHSIYTGLSGVTDARTWNKVK